MLIRTQLPKTCLDGDRNHQIRVWLNERGLKCVHAGWVTTRVKGFQNWTMDKLAVHEQWNNRFVKLFPNSVVMGWGINISSDQGLVEWWFPDTHLDIAVLFKLTWSGK